ncbi:MAG: MBL fold metallo-hydrolase [Candidatus Omnitrophica bacterium]|nr:MBL fold metallo-hydrolase [Candidatus Omnitrophota bacterium]
MQSNRRCFLKASVLGVAGIVFAGNRTAFAASELTEEERKLLSGFTWFKQSGFRILDGDKVIYFDPYQLTQTIHDADVIFISHSHGDHCDIASIQRIIKDSTRIVTEPESAAKIASISSNVITVSPGDTITIDDYICEAVPSYNVNKTNHPKSKNYLGFIVTLRDGRRIYHAGDTDRISEMTGFNADVALLPCGGTYTMSAAEAAEAAKDIQPKLVVPMHYGAAVGSIRDAEQVRDLLAGVVPVVIMDEGQTIDPLPTKILNHAIY